MKYIYESFYEAAQDYVKGKYMTHRASSHTHEECLGWQHGVLEFAQWLDNVGLQITQTPEAFELLWEKLSPYRREQERKS